MDSLMFLAKLCPSLPRRNMGQVCGWYLCHPQGGQQTRLPSTHKQCWPCHKVYSRGQQGGWLHPLFGHYCKTRGWWWPVHYCIQETPHIQTSIYSGTVTITSQPNSVSSKLFPTGLPPCAVILSCFKKKRSTSGKLSPNATTPNGLWTRWRKGLTSLPDRLMMGAATVPKLPTKECKVRVILSFPTHKVFVKVSKGSVVGLASKLTSRVALPSKTFWSPPRTKTLWSTKVVPYTGTNVVT